MKKIILFLFSLHTALYGLGQYTAQERAEETVKKHLISVFTKEKYKSFGFEELYKVSPAKITEIDNLKKKVDVLRRKNLLTDSSLSYYDSLIKLKVDTVRAKKLYSTYEINHYFVVKEKGNKNVLYYYHFELFPDGKIKELEQLMKLEFVNIEYDWFYSYYRRNTLILDDAKENATCYAYLDNLIQSNTDDRESAMATVLATHGVLARYSYMDTVKLPRIIAQNWLQRNHKGQLKILNYSKIQPIYDNENKIGYKLFAEYDINGVKKAHYFEFDLNFLVRGNLIVERPYEKYFTK